jgi:hypothetical protein
MKYGVEMASDDMIYISSFMKIGTSVQAILKFCLRNLRDCEVGITDGWGGGYELATETGSVAVTHPRILKLGTGWRCGQLQAPIA